MSGDLFTPSLSPEDRADAFDRPWNPWHLVFVAFFGGLAGAAVLQAMNWRRLGLPDRGRPTAIGLGALAVGLGIGAGVAYGAFVETGRMDASALRLATRLVAVGVAAAVAGAQYRRFQIAERLDIEAGKVLVPVLLGIVGGMATHFVLVMIGGNL